MPELPEVEVIRRTLAPHVTGKRITEVTVGRAHLRRPLPHGFGSALTGRTIESLDRKGKFLLFHLAPAGTWLVHLGMSGSLAIRRAGAFEHDHVRVGLGGNLDLVYNDPRRFGWMNFVQTGVPPELAALGPDPFEPAFTFEVFCSCCQRRRPIRNLLTDQTAIAGIGNIYASEILFRARVRPGKASRRLSRAERRRVYEAIAQVLGEAIRLGGTSVANFRDGEGRPGFFQMRLQVYGRQGQRCLRCGCAIRRRVLAGRSAFYCPGCQR